MSKKKSKGGKAAAAGKAAGDKAAKARAAESKKTKAPKAEKQAEPKVSQAELDALRKPVEAAKNEDIPALIRELRQRLDLTQEQFAQRVGVTYSTVNHWENGKRVPLPFLVTDSWR